MAVCKGDVDLCVCADMCGKATDELLANSSCELCKQQEQEPDMFSKQCYHGNTACSTHDKDQDESVETLNRKVLSTPHVFGHCAVTLQSPFYCTYVRMTLHALVHKLISGSSVK